uniref:Uncharacterized protein n=1 Tax=Megaselia scalaris TaxID=36166 RepID=T1GA74_MEGSC
MIDDIDTVLTESSCIRFIAERMVLGLWSWGCGGLLGRRHLTIYNTGIGVNLKTALKEKEVRESPVCKFQILRKFHQGDAIM